MIVQEIGLSRSAADPLHSRRSAFQVVAEPVGAEE
jgi:hypothetical protein